MLFFRSLHFLFALLSKPMWHYWVNILLTLHNVYGTLKESGSGGDKNYWNEIKWALKFFHGNLLKMTILIA